MWSLTRSNQHFENAAGRLPLGVASNFRYWGDDKTIYLKRDKGGRLWDIDDNEYIDYRLGYGPAILGILVEPDSREPWFLCEAHDVKCLNETLDKFERAVDITLDKMASKQVPVNAA